MTDIDYSKKIGDTTKTVEVEVSDEDLVKVVKDRMDKEVGNVVDLVFRDILKFDVDRIEKVANVIGTTIDKF